MGHLISIEAARFADQSSQLKNRKIKKGAIWLMATLVKKYQNRKMYIAGQYITYEKVWELLERGEEIQALSVQRFGDGEPRDITSEVVRTIFLKKLQTIPFSIEDQLRVIRGEKEIYLAQAAKDIAV